MASEMSNRATHLCDQLIRVSQVQRNQRRAVPYRRRRRDLSSHFQLPIDAPHLGSLSATVIGLEPCLRADQASLVVLAVVVRRAGVDVLPGRLVQATVLRVPNVRLARRPWLHLREPAVVLCLGILSDFRAVSFAAF